MAAHPYNLRARVNSPSISVKTPTSSTSFSRVASRSPRKPSVTASAIQLKHIIGTTTANPSGLACCQSTNSFAYCAGSVAVLTTIDDAEQASYRYFKAKPTAAAINATTSYFDTPSTQNTPTKRRSVIPARRGHDEASSAGFGREWLDEGGGQTWSARERIKAATCVALSPDGKLLAVGETGYNPRVLIFSTAVGAPTDQPLSIIAEHTIGVRCVAFSPDSKYLATLGDVNDGFLHIWQVASKTGDVKLHSTNKCTTNVCDMTWIGNNIVTVGTRHTKVWHIPSSGRGLSRKPSRIKLDGEAVNSPGPMPLRGRNCLLGKLADSTFTAIVAVSSDTAVLCTDNGQICKLDLSDGRTELSTVDNADVATGAICIRSTTRQIIWSGRSGDLQIHDSSWWPRAAEKECSTDEEDTTDFALSSRHAAMRASSGTHRPAKARVVALNCLADHIISIDVDGNVRMLNWDGKPSNVISQRLSSHQDITRGVQILNVEDGLGDFFTWARNGEVRFWDAAGQLLRSEHCELDEATFDDSVGTNELKAVRYLSGTDQFLVGDRYGLLKLLDRTTWSTVQVIRGHSAEVTDVAIHRESNLVVTCGRDRMIQLFRLSSSQLSLIQTLDEHISAVQRVCFSPSGHRLVSCSTDRTVVIRERMEREQDGETMTAFLSARVVTLKASPLSMALLSRDQNILIVSTMDRHVVRVDVASGSVLEAFKVGDKDTDDTSILNAICLSSSLNVDEQPFVVGYSSIDKSIRVYDLQKGVLYGREFGHTEGISDLALLERRQPNDDVVQRIIISTGLDSTVMMWSLSAPSQPILTPLHELSQEQASLYDSDCTPTKASPVSLPPLRRILSKVDVAEFVKHNSPSREPSPHRLRRKTSRLAFSTSIDENEEDSSQASSRTRSRERNISMEKRSPSPPTKPVRPKKQRSKTDMLGTLEKQRSDWFRRSPSPPPMPVSTPTTPKHQRANNSRLRRPPSVPADLRAHVAAQQRRQSTSNTGDFGSIGMASEQACRMLKTYRKRLTATRGDLDLEEVQHELETTLQAVLGKRMKPSKPAASSPNQQKVELVGEVDQLAVLLEKATVE